MEKMRVLYKIGNIADYKYVLKQAIKTNFPIVTKEHLKHLYKNILEEEIYIEDDQIFIAFLTACIEAHNQENMVYAEKIKALLPESEY